MQNQMELLSVAHEEANNELHNAVEELAQKNVLLENSNKELQSFAYISSHDLQEPLRKIQAFASRLLEKENDRLSDEGKDAFRRMQDAAHRMQKLIDELLAYSRTNTTERKFEITNITDVIEDVKNDLKESLQEKGAVVEIRNQLCDLKVIRFQFRQLMTNLIANSIKFARVDVPPRIIITDEKVHGSQLRHLPISPRIDYCHIEVSDNGIGFDNEYKERIFEVFQRLHGRHEYPGTGIGLAICKKIVENHRGIIYANGGVDRGATFHIYIPLDGDR